MREIASSHPRVHRSQSVLSGGRYGGGGEDDTDQTGKLARQDKTLFLKNTNKKIHVMSVIDETNFHVFFLHINGCIPGDNVNTVRLIYRCVPMMNVLYWNMRL